MSQLSSTVIDQVNNMMANTRYSAAAVERHRIVEVMREWLKNLEMPASKSALDLEVLLLIKNIIDADLPDKADAN